MKIYVDKEVLDNALETLKRTPCTFWACPGWDKPFEHMKTCSLCSTIQELQQEIDINS